ncbi:MAG: ABC transporter substrate-binding protein [Spirochaetaceae bacterium]|nr:ABC transporter substrate-binding protein [Spirochaetaceae bacterium]
MRTGTSRILRGAGRLAATAALVVALAAGLTTPVVADDGEIVWGGSVPLTGIYAQAGALGSLGMDAYVGYLNATGGINGRPVRMETRDSGSEPENALAIFKQIMAEEEDVVAFYGDSTEFAILSTPEVNERYQVLMGGSSLATVLADPVNYPYQFLTGPTYAEMVGMLLEYIAEQGGTEGAAPRVALFHSNLEFGRDPIPAAREHAAELGVEIVAEIETEPSGIDVAPEVLKLRRAEPDYVIFHGYVTTVWPEVMKQAVQSGVDAMFMGTFWAMEPLVIQQLGPLADRYMGVFPYRYYWEQEESATLRLIAQVTQAEYVPTFALQAWFSGMILTEVIKRTLDAGMELTGDNLKAALDGIEDWDTGGLIGVPVTFRNNSIPVGRIYKGNSATGRMDPVSDWIVLDD